MNDARTVRFTAAGLEEVRNRVSASTSRGALFEAVCESKLSGKSNERGMGRMYLEIPLCADGFERGFEMIDLFLEILVHVLLKHTVTG